MTNRKKCSKSDCQNPLTDENGLLPLNEFYKHYKAKDGLKYSCKHCARHYRISETGKAADRKYNTSEKGGISRKKAKRSPKGKASDARYQASEKGRDNARRHRQTGKYKDGFKRRQETYKETGQHQERLIRYNTSEKGKCAKQKYKVTPKGKVTTRRYSKSALGKQAAVRKQATRRARKTKAGGSFTKEEWEALCAKYDYRCLSCHQKKPLEPDHIKPIALGGTSNIDNIQPLCRNCNASKGDKHIDYRY